MTAASMLRSWLCSHQHLMRLPQKLLVCLMRQICFAPIAP